MTKKNKMKRKMIKMKSVRLKMVPWIALNKHKDPVKSQLYSSIIGKFYLVGINLDKGDK